MKNMMVIPQGYLEMENKMGKYAQSIGVLELQIGQVKEDVKPRMGDNRKVAAIVSGYQKHKDQARMLKEIGDFVFELITRENSGLLDEDKEELQLAIEMNQMQIMEDVMVAFKWTTKEDMQKAKEQSGDVVKNLTSGTN